jgi:hypothetical protein
MYYKPNVESIVKGMIVKMDFDPDTLRQRTKPKGSTAWIAALYDNNKSVKPICRYYEIVTTTTLNFEDIVFFQKYSVEEKYAYIEAFVNFMRHMAEAYEVTVIRAVSNNTLFNELLFEQKYDLFKTLNTITAYKKLT